MTTTRTRASRTAGLLAAALFLLPTAACSDATVGDEGAADTSESPAEDTTDDAEAAETSPAEPPGDRPAAEIDCAGTSCTLTLASGQEADVLGTTVAFTSGEDGVATLRIADEDATCREGENVAAGPLEVECTAVSDDQVTLTAGLG